MGLYLLHLPEVDKDMCFEREHKKYLAIQIAHQRESAGGFNGHIQAMPQLLASGQLCKNARFVVSSVSKEDSMSKEEISRGELLKGGLSKGELSREETSKGAINKEATRRGVVYDSTGRYRIEKMPDAFAAIDV